jgi:hypothetical protein
VSAVRGARPKRASASGATIVELMLAIFLALIVVYALGRIILANQRSWEWARDKIVLQQNVTEALEWMARNVRAARSVDVVSPNELHTFDEDGNITHSFLREAVAGSFRLRQDGSDLVDRVCTQFLVTPDDDSTSVTLVVELQDKAGNKVKGMTRAALRNLSYEF